MSFAFIEIDLLCKVLVIQLYSLMVLVCSRSVRNEFAFFEAATDSDLLISVLRLCVCECTFMNYYAWSCAAAAAATV
jgi:hypothetical protein